MWKQVLRDAIDHLGRAVSQRERIYQGQREAKLEAHRRGTTSLIEQQRFMASTTAQELIADQNWQMRQADAHSGIAVALLLEELLREQRKTRILLELINGKMEDK